MVLKNVKSYLRVLVITSAIMYGSPYVQNVQAQELVATLNTTLPQRMNIDSPVTNSNVSANTVRLEGWALNGSGLSSVKVYVDGALKGTAQLNQPRPDVNKVYPGYSTGDNSGYFYDLNSLQLSAGKHTVAVEAVGNDNTTQKVSLILNVVKLSQRMNIDSPAMNSNVSILDMKINGWALNPAGTQEVKIYVDDKFAGNADINQKREDVNKAYPGYVDGANSGFNFNFDAKELSAGKHTVRVEAVGKDNTVQKSTNSFNIVKLPLRMNIDDIYNGYIINSNSLKIRGWALDQSGIKEAKIYVNGQYLNNASINQSRPDVNKAYPGYVSGDNNGFSYDLNTRVLPSGANKIAVEIIGNNNSIQKREITIVKPQLTARMNIDSPSFGYISDNKDILLKGWALHPAGVKEINVYLDGVYIGSTITDQNRSDVDNAIPGYIDGDKSGFIYNLDVDKISSGLHDVKVEVVAKDNLKYSSNTKFEIKKPQLRMNIEEPYKSWEYVEEAIKVSGWALNPSSTKEIKIYANDAYIGQAKLNILREDVNKAYPQYGIKDSGFEYLIDKSKLNDGENKLKVQVIGNDGTLQVTEYKIKVVKAIFRMELETPTETLFYNNRDITFSGWVLNPSGVKDIKVYVNGQYKANANYGQARPDIYNNFPGYPQGQNSGFTYNLDIRNFTEGDYEVAIEVTGKDGKVNIITKKFNVVDLIPRGNIDEPQSDQVLLNNNTLDLRGWALHKYGLKEVKLYIDGNYKGNANFKQSRPDVIKAYPGYPDGANNGYSASLNISNLTMGIHKLTIQAVGNDGTVIENSVNFNMYGFVSYKTYANNFDYYLDRQFNEGKNVDWKGNEMSKDQVAYYMNPNNFVNDPSGKFMFMKLTYTAGISVNDLNKVLVGKGVLEGKGQVFMQAGIKNNVNPIYLVAHSLLETGNGTSTLAKGVLVNQLHVTENGQTIVKDVEPKVVYNMYGINAFDDTPVVSGSEKAYNEKWYSVDEAIIGGAAWIGKNYINSTKYQQDTLYKMKWDLVGFWHEYATDIAWAYKQTYKIKELVDKMTDSVLYYEIPTFIEK